MRRPSSQAPSCEFFPMEAIRTNAIGADNVMKAALACNVKNMIVLSTDKAVYPIQCDGDVQGVDGNPGEVFVQKTEDRGRPGEIRFAVTGVNFTG
jgi:FlaA1/EpsC-like NDP-sugar epimerase